MLVSSDSALMFYRSDWISVDFLKFCHFFHLTYKCWGISALADLSEFLPLLFSSLNPTSALLPVRCRVSCLHLNCALPQCPVSTWLSSQWWKTGISFLDMSPFWETLTTYLELGNKCHLNFSDNWFQTLSAAHKYKHHLPIHKLCCALQYFNLA